MELAPRLIEVAKPDRPQAVVLVLHGGASRRSSAMVSPTQLSVLRMIPIARRIAAAAGHRLAVYRVLNSARGWDAHHTPVQDVRWALDRVAEANGERLAACLVGHSLGGRAALLSANRPEVSSVVALAPWVYPNEAAGGLDGEQILFVHGSRDRIASPERSAALAARLRGSARVGYITVEGGKHAMLRRHSVFDSLAAEFCSVSLLGSTATGAIGRLQSGEAWVHV
ncbi:MAG: alpha/beta fold hydrolase [Candidatus Dormibacteraeota bacterium]|nr:alpha/beta fold hydrolase [Candidatus Dormibacteraeota bacterium]